MKEINPEFVAKCLALREKTLTDAEEKLEHDPRLLIYFRMLVSVTGNGDLNRREMEAVVEAYHGFVMEFLAFADEEGAQVWEVKFQEHMNPFKSCRVLAITESDAEKAAQDWEIERYEPEDDEDDES